MRAPGIFDAVKNLSSLFFNLKKIVMNYHLGDFGPEINNLLNRIANYGKDEGYSPSELEQIFNAGIAARSIFLARQSADTSDASR
jgi:hypothetical protein